VDETTAMGAAYAAGLATGYWADPEELREHWRVDRRFDPGDADAADRKYARWDDAITRARDWARD
jgi:glycerol kinase